MATDMPRGSTRVVDRIRQCIELTLFRRLTRMTPRGRVTLPRRNLVITRHYY